MKAWDFDGWCVKSIALI